MIRKFGLFVLLLGVAAISASNKKALENFSVHYTITGSGDNEQVNQMLENASMTIYAADKLARVDLDMMMNVQMMMNETKREGLMLMNVMGQKIAVTIDPDTYDDFEKQQAGAKKEVKLTSAKKKILGYNCQLANVKDDKGNNIAVWYTKELGQISRASGYSYDLDGLPLEMDVVQNGIQMTFKATKVSTDKPKAGLFKMEIPEGYTEMTFEQLQKMGG